MKTYAVKLRAKDAPRGTGSIYEARTLGEVLKMTYARRACGCSVHYRETGATAWQVARVATLRKLAEQEGTGS